jgi:hypothetical protein
MQQLLYPVKDNTFLIPPHVNVFILLVGVISGVFSEHWILLVGESKYRVEGRKHMALTGQINCSVPLG